MGVSHVPRDDGVQPGWFTHARRCCGLGIPTAPSLRLCRSDECLTFSENGERSLLTKFPRQPCDREGLIGDEKWLEGHEHYEKGGGGDMRSKSGSD